MKDSTVDKDQEIRELTLMTNATHPNQAFNEYDAMLEEAHYIHTMNAFVELIVLYGWDKVTSDLRQAMGEKQW